MKPNLSVLHVIDALDVGGAENVLALLVNRLSKAGIDVSVCATWKGGRLESRIDPNIEIFILGRRSKLDLFALGKFVKHNYTKRIEIIHAHSYSLFISVLASFFPPFPKVIWHDHYGDSKPRSKFWHSLFVRRCSAVICVKQNLMDWIVNSLGYPSEKTFYIENPSWLEKNVTVDHNEFRDRNRNRIVCLANLRPQKDHITLIRALYRVINQISDVHLLLVGAIHYDEYYLEVCEEIDKLGIADHISILGERDDIYDILSSCDIGILSSIEEGLPLALLEYGYCNLAVIATDVGQISQVLVNGVSGTLVKPKDPASLSESIIAYLSDCDTRRLHSDKFHKYVLENHSLEIVIPKILDIYFDINAHKLR